MAKHRTTDTHRVNPLLGGALLAGGLLMAAAPIASADEPAAGGRPDTSFSQPGVNAIQNVGDPVFDGTRTIPGFLGGGPISLDGTDAGQLYHASFGYSATAANNLSTPDAPISAGQGITVGVVNSFATPYKLRCNLVVQTACGGTNGP